MKKISFLCLLLTVLTMQGFSQNEEETTAEAETKGFKKENLFVGGNLGANFGNLTQIILSPQVGYRFKKWFAAGVGVNMQYVGLKVFDNQGNDLYKQTQGVYGVNVFARAYPIRQAFIQLQPEFNWIKNKVKYNNPNFPDQKFNSNAPSLLVGAGVGFGGGYIALNYDLLQNSNAPYGKEVFVSVGFGF